MVNILNIWGTKLNKISSFDNYNNYINECINTAKKYFSKKCQQNNYKQKIICPKFCIREKERNSFYSKKSILSWKKIKNNIIYTNNEKKMKMTEKKKIHSLVNKNSIKEKHIFMNYLINNSNIDINKHNNIKTNKKYIFIGDIHGDINQFLAPLIKEKICKNFNYDMEHNKFIYDKDINFDKINVIFMGDIFHYSIYDDIIANTIIDLIKYDTFTWILGNHDALIISYGLLKDKRDFIKIFDIKKFQYIFRSYLPGVQYLFNSLILTKEGRSTNEFNNMFNNLNLLYHTNDISSKMIQAMKKRKIVYSLVINKFFISHASITENGIRELIMLLKYNNSFISNLKNEYTISNQNYKYLFNSINHDNINYELSKIKKESNIYNVSLFLNTLILNLNGLFFLQKIKLLNVVSPSCIFNSINGHISGIKNVQNEDSPNNLFKYKSCYNPIQRNLNCLLGILNYNGTLTKYVDFGSSVQQTYNNDIYKLIKLSQPDYLIYNLDKYEYSNLNIVFAKKTNKIKNKTKLKIYNTNEFYENLFK